MMRQVWASLSRKEGNERRCAMERNLSFDTEGLEKIAVHLGWAQLEMFADEVDGCR